MVHWFGKKQIWCCIINSDNDNQQCETKLCLLNMVQTLNMVKIIYTCYLYPYKMIDIPAEFIKVYLYVTYFSSALRSPVIAATV